MKTPQNEETVDTSCQKKWKKKKWFFSFLRSSLTRQTHVNTVTVKLSFYKLNRGQSKEKCTTFISQIHTSHSIRNTKPAQLIQTVSPTSIKNNSGQFKEMEKKKKSKLKQTYDDSAFNNKTPRVRRTRRVGVKETSHCFLQHTIFMASTCLSVCVTVDKVTSRTADKHVDFQSINPIFFSPFDGNKSDAASSCCVTEYDSSGSSHHDSGWSTEIVQHAIHRIEKVNQTRIVCSKIRERVDDRKSRIPLQEVVGTRGGTLENFF